MGFEICKLISNYNSYNTYGDHILSAKIYDKLTPFLSHPHSKIMEIVFTLNLTNNSKYRAKRKSFRSKKKWVVRVAITTKGKSFVFK